MTNRSFDAVIRDGISLALVVMMAGAVVAACSSPPVRPRDGDVEDDTTGGPSYGQPCDDESQCRDDAPNCVPIAAAAYSPGICSHPCEGGPGGTCEAGSECQQGACIRCAAEVAGTIAADGACGCDADCAAGTCFFGTCTVSCAVAGCDTGFSCDGTPPTCRECLGGGPFGEEGPCGCNADCDTGLECLGDLCLRPCVIDEMCGADQCGHELGAPASCIAPDPACTGSGDVAPGQPCACNADCGPLGPYCLGAFVEGVRTTICSNTCSMKSLCPSGTDCCSTVPGFLYCLPESVSTGAGATCL